MTRSPILFLIFNRPDTTARVFEAIRQAQPARLYIAADGPREGRAGEADLCEQTRKVALEVDWPCQVTTLLRNENLGCKKAVSSAINWFFEHEPEGIILEDDCLPARDFSGFVMNYLKSIGMTLGSDQSRVITLFRRRGGRMKAITFPGSATFGVGPHGAVHGQTTM